MAMEGRSKARYATAAILVLVLGAGMVLGVALDRTLEARALAAHEAERPDRRGGHDDRFRGYSSRSRDPDRGSEGGQREGGRRPNLLVEQVGLSEEQNEKVDSIVQYFRARMRELHDEFDEAYKTRSREVMDLTREEINAILTPEQQVAYDSLRAEWSRKRQERRSDSVPRGGGPL